MGADGRSGNAKLLGLDESWRICVWYNQMRKNGDVYETVNTTYGKEGVR